jgi:GntR family transcriptional repressor for pyruvate dehydrogenase complex
MLSPLTKSRLHQDIVVQLKDRILRGDWQAGDKLPTERDLAEQLAVNRATVREALHKLESLGLVEIRHGSGIFVRDYRESGSLELLRLLLVQGGQLNAGVMQNLADLRRLLVPEISFLAAKNRSAADLKELERLIESCPAMPIEEKDWRVHNVLARMSGNLLFVILLNAFHRMTEDVAKVYFEDPTNCEVTGEFHQDILYAVRRQDAAKAKRIMAEVLDWAEKHLESK